MQNFSQPLRPQAIDGRKVVIPGKRVTLPPQLGPSLKPELSLDPKDILDFKPSGKLVPRKPGDMRIDGREVVHEMNRQRNLSPQDRKLFDFLNKQEPKPVKPGGPIDGRSVVDKMRRRAAMDPKERAQLEFLEKAQADLANIKPGRGFTGSAEMKRREYMNSLPPDKRALLEKVLKENDQRPGGVYPFNQDKKKSPSNQTYSPGPLTNLKPGAKPDQLRRFALGSGRSPFFGGG